MKDGHIIEADGSEKWYLQGKLHREDGPAITRASGSEFWYSHGKKHREDGPAVTWTDGSKSYYLYEKKLTEKEFLEITGATDEELPVYLGKGYDEYIEKRLESGGQK